MMASRTLDRIATGGMGSVEMLACFREPRAANWSAIAALRSERLRLSRLEYG
jgi:hypothetical protein